MLPAALPCITACWPFAAKDIVTAGALEDHKSVAARAIAAWPLEHELRPADWPERSSATESRLAAIPVNRNLKSAVAVLAAGLHSGSVDCPQPVCWCSGR